MVVYSGLHVASSQPLHGEYCIESAMQPSPPTEKSSRTTLHYVNVIQNDSAHDLVLPPLPDITCISCNRLATQFLLGKRYAVQYGSQVASYPGPHAERGRGPGDTWQNSRMC